MPQLSGLNENSFCKTEKENSLIYSLTINENEAETKVKGLKVHLKLKYSHVLKEVMEYGLDLLKRCLCFSRQNPENLFFRKDDCHPTLNLYSFTNNG